MSMAVARTETTEGGGVLFFRNLGTPLLGLVMPYWPLASYATVTPIFANKQNQPSLQPKQQHMRV